MSELEATMKALARRFQDRCVRDRGELCALSLAGQAGGPRAREIAHGLSGAGGTFGFPEVSVRARALEQAIDAAAPAAAPLAALLDEMVRCAEAEPELAI